MNKVSSKSTEKTLADAQANAEKLHGILNQYQTACGLLDSEVRTLEAEHKQAAIDAALDGKPAIKMPKRLAESRAELETSLSVRDDLRIKYDEANAQLTEAKKAHETALAGEVMAKLEKPVQADFAKLLELFVSLVERAGDRPWYAMRNVLDYCMLWEGIDPIADALKGSGIDPHRAADFEMLPDGQRLHHYADRASEAHNGEPVKPDGIERL